MKKPLIIVGDSAFAEIAWLYFSETSEYETVAFSVEREFIKKTTFCGLPVVPFEELRDTYSTEKHEVFAAINYQQMNRLRARLSRQAKKWGYRLASYVSPHAFISSNAQIGEHCFIFENNVIQPFSKIGNDVILWSGNHIGHHSEIDDHCFVSSHVVISGFCKIGSHCFLGVNSTIANNVSLGSDCWLSPNVAILKDVQAGTLYKAPITEPSPIDTYKFFKIK